VPASAALSSSSISTPDRFLLTNYVTAPPGFRPLFELAIFRRTMLLKLPGYPVTQRRPGVRQPIAALFAPIRPSSPTPDLIGPAQWPELPADRRR